MGHIPAAEYRKVIIGLIFLRYISSAFEKRYAELVAEGEGFEEDRDEYLGENVFIVPEKARWSTIASVAHTPEIGTVIDDAMRAIEAENKFLKNVLPKNYASPDMDKRVLRYSISVIVKIVVSKILIFFGYIYIWAAGLYSGLRAAVNDKTSCCTIIDSCSQPRVYSSQAR